MVFLSDLKILEGSQPPSYAHFSPKSSDQNFEIVILWLSIVINVFEDDFKPPQSPGKGLQVMNFAHCLHTVLVTWKYTDVLRGDFSGWGTWEDISVEEFFMGEGNFPWRGSRI